MFEDRTDAGKQLAEKFVADENEEALVIALPRGGVSVGFPVAQSLKVPLEVIVVRKIGSPYNPELGIGAVAEDGVLFLDTEMLDLLQISNTTLRSLEQKEYIELERRKRLYRNGQTLPLLTNKTIILVDDGLATGVTAHAALLSLKKHHPKKIIFAIPVCTEETVQAIRPMVDKIICLNIPEQLDAIGRYYKEFPQMTDEEVMRLLHKVNENSSLKNSSENDFAHKIVW